MLKHIAIGSEYREVKFHGKVKFLLFECNTCHEHFSKMESYVKKQMKKRPTACSFCSPRCRSIYLTGVAFRKKYEDVDTEKSKQNTLGNLISKVFHH